MSIPPSLLATALPYWVTMGSITVPRLRSMASDDEGPVAVATP